MASGNIDLPPRAGAGAVSDFKGGCLPFGKVFELDRPSLVGGEAFEAMCFVVEFDLEVDWPCVVSEETFDVSCFMLECELFEVLLSSLFSSASRARANARSASSWPE